MRSKLAMTLLILLLPLAGCGGESVDERGQRVGVRGAVSLDGSPLNRARIVFRAAEGPSKITATGSIVEGFYEIPPEAGPLIGLMRVEIQADSLEMEEYEAARGGNVRKRVPVQAVAIPAVYNTKSTLTANVSADETQNKFDFRLESKPSPMK